MKLESQKHIGLMAGRWISVILLLASCSTGPEDISGPTSGFPDWITSPPIEEDFLFGIGQDEDLYKAKEKSIVNLGQSYSSQITSVLEDSAREGADGEGTVTVSSIGRQLTDVDVVGAKFIDQHQDAKGYYWILSRAPTDCMLDAAESVLLSYRMDLELSEEEMDIILQRVSESVSSQSAFYFSERPEVGSGLVFVHGATFAMGRSDGIHENEKPVHDVRLDDFWMSPFEVTQDEWMAVMGSSPSHFQGSDLPVENITWFEAVEYCNALSLKEGLEPCYSGEEKEIQCDFSQNGYRLPTEAEWEYAARGGYLASGSFYSGGDNVDAVGWYVDNSGGTTHPVGTKAPNVLGLYDMSGNVWEWCWDRYGRDYYTQSPGVNPQGPAEGEYRVFRGGSWNYLADYLRPDFRENYFPSNGFNHIGFRVCRTAG